MGRLRCFEAAAALLLLVIECQSFYLPGPSTSRVVRRGSAAAKCHQVPTTRFETLTTPAGTSWHGVATCSRNTESRGVQPLQVLASSGDFKPGSKQNADESVDAPTPFTPKLLWWTTSRAEEDAALNLVVNAGIIAGVVLFAIGMVFTVDAEVSRGWTAAEFFLRVPIDNWQSYMGELRDNPILVKACTSGTVYALGDWTAQTLEGVALSDIKRGRVLRSALAGLLLHGPLSHVWYDVCEGIFNTIGWNDYWWVAGPKIITDQLLWGPFWNGVYICFLGALKRDSFDSIREAVVTTALPLVLAGVRLWPLAHIVTYGLIPTENRLLWVDFVEIIWVTILSKQAAEQARSAKETVPTDNE